MHRGVKFISIFLCKSEFRHANKLSFGEQGPYVSIQNESDISCQALGNNPRKPILQRTLNYHRKIVISIMVFIRFFLSYLIRMVWKFTYSKLN